jgi:two-component system chemotaxis response regulator CheY
MAIINLDNELGEDYLAQSRACLGAVEADLLALEKGGAQTGAPIDDELINRVLQAVHSVKGGAGFFELSTIRTLAHQTEDALALIRSRKMVPTPDRVSVLLHATDKLRELINDPGASHTADIAEIMAALAGLREDRPAGAGHAHQEPKRLRLLLVEDDFSSRLLLQTFLSRYGECHIAVNGREAVDAVRAAFERSQMYDLICMDLMMPEMDGREAVRQVRAMEEARGILSPDGAKIIMTTAVDDVKEVIQCFKELCDGYLVKPIDLAQLLSHMRAHRLIA